MTNNKQQTAVEWFIEELEYKGDLRETPSIRNIQLNIDTSEDHYNQTFGGGNNEKQ